MPCLLMNDVLEEMAEMRVQLHYKNVELEDRMEPCELEDFERTHKLRFPGEYRMYLLELANGIRDNIGPCREGILPFGETPIGYPLDFSAITYNLNRPFPYKEQVLFNDEETKKHGSRHEKVGGYIVLGTCLNSNDSYWILICEGSCRGQVWIVNWSVGLFPCHARLSYREWLKDWVENDGRTIHLLLRGLPLWFEEDVPVNFYTRRRRGAVEFRHGLLDFLHANVNTE